MNVSLSVPLPEAYLAMLGLSPPVSSISRGSPTVVTSSVNATVMLIVSPAIYVPFCADVVTLTTCVGDSRISWTPLPHHADTMAYILPPISNVSTPLEPPSADQAGPVAAPWRSTSWFGTHPFRARPASESVPLSPTLMRIIWTPWPARAATMAYVVPSISNVSTSRT